ncbi:MAG: PASTA domain-containing protein, partial [Paramuribaculum sp.]|nr:PASTA domain-containing protein [Paramuribaculum sp.]
PKVSTKVKHGRTVYLTVNAFAPRSVTVPALTDMSLRQARSILEGLGIKNIVVREVPSEYKDLVLNVTRDGHRLMPGARIPTTSSVTIEVGAGVQEYANDAISVDMDDVDFLDIN